MSRVLLISANTTQDPMPVYPLGMALVDASLKQYGHETRQFDLLHVKKSKSDSLDRMVKDFQPEIMGISLRNIDNVDSLSQEWYLSGIKDLVNKLRGLSTAPIVLGGPGFSIMPEIILNFSMADYGVVGEGEISFNQLIPQILRGKNPPRITGPLVPQMNSQDFYSPEYDETLVDFYIDQSGMVNYQTKRGCPYGCNYCSYPLIEGKQFRYQDPEFVAENILRLKKDFNVDTLFFTDSIFNDPQGRYLEIARAMIQKNCKIQWAAYFRPDEISPEDLALLKQSGLYAMEVGSDAACDATLTGINKNFGFSRVLSFNEAAIKADIPCAHFFMFGGPNETPATIEESITNIEKLKKTVVFGFSGIRILPNTGIAKIARAQSIITMEDNLLEPRYYVSPEIDKERMDQRIEQAFFRRKDRFFPPEKGQIRIQALQAFGFKGLLWNMISHTQPKKRYLKRKH